MNKQKCPVCKTEFRGRIDKIYCSLKCKSINQYESRREKEKFYFQVDAQLKTNRKLLKKYNKTGKTILRREVLLIDGFNSNYFTHYWKNDKGDVYFFCYDYGFLNLKEGDKKKYIIVEWQDYMRNNKNGS